jgi:hypothetical protein
MFPVFDWSIELIGAEFGRMSASLFILYQFQIQDVKRNYKKQNTNFNPNTILLVKEKLLVVNWTIC